MQSRISFFDKRVSLHLLRRFLPLWLAWLATLLLAVFNVNDRFTGSSPAEHLSILRVNLLTSGEALVWISFVAGALMAMAMLSYLYFPRDCGLINSLPLRRETVYFTAVLTGLVPMLLCDVLAFGLLWALYGRKGVGTEYFLWWLKMVAPANIGFYGIACFCGTLTGHVLVLPAVYVVLSCAAAMFEGAVRSVFSTLLYGYCIGSIWSEWLSPPVWFTDHRSYQSLQNMDREKGIAAAYAPGWIGYLAGVCAVGLVLAILGVLIVRRRHMESAGEIVAVPVLRPVFRVCMTVGCGLGIPMFWAAATADYRPTSFAMLVLSVLLCAALGFFLAEMLIKKTLRVFDHGWKQLGVLCACLLAFLILTKLDVTGYETHIPDRAEIESVELTDYIGGTLREPETIDAFLDFQRGVVAHREENRSALPDRRAHNIWLTYHLKNGKTYTRYYLLPLSDELYADLGSDLRAWERVMNMQEVRMLKLWADVDWSEADVENAWVEITREREGDMGPRVEAHEPLTPAQAVSLYREGIFPDAENGNIYRWHLWDSEEAQAERTNLLVTIYLRRDARGQEYAQVFPMSAPVLTCSENTLRWLKDNMGLTPSEEIHGGHDDQQLEIAALPIEQPQNQQQ